MLASVSVAAATAVLGYDLLTGSVYKQSRRNRRLRGVALCGSAAGGDTKVDIMVDNVKVGEVFNVTTGFPTRDHLFGLGAPVPAGAEVAVLVTDAPGTNPINLLLDFAE